MAKLGIITTCAAAVLSFNVYGESKAISPLQDYTRHAKLYFYICDNQQRNEAHQLEFYNKKPKPSNDYRQCIEDGNLETTKLYKNAFNTLSGHPKRIALKNYHIATINSLKGIEPGRDESVSDYNRRQQALKDKLSDAWTRFDLEQ